MTMPAMAPPPRPSSPDRSLRLPSALPTKVAAQDGALEPTTQLATSHTSKFPHTVFVQSTEPPQPTLIRSHSSRHAGRVYPVFASQRGKDSRQARPRPDDSHALLRMLEARRIASVSAVRSLFIRLPVGVAYSSSPSIRSRQTDERPTSDDATSRAATRSPPGVQVADEPVVTSSSAFTG